MQSQDLRAAQRTLNANYTQSFCWPDVITVGEDGPKKGQDSSTWAQHGQKQAQHSPNISQYAPNYHMPTCARRGPELAALAGSHGHWV